MVHHGGKLETLRRRFPDAPTPLIDLSTGINPHAYPLPTAPIEAFTRLPEDGEIQRLKEAAAAAYGCADPDMVAVAPGTQILISTLPRLFPADTVAILSPTYGEHAAAWSQAGAAVTEVSSLECDAAVNDGAAAVVLCNPNNPDGRIVDPETLLAFRDERAAAGGMLFVDEAFAEFSEAALSVAPRMSPTRDDGIVVFRSFGKAYGLAGVRLGFLIAHPARIEQVDRMLGPWPVSGLAIRVADAALRDTAWRQETGQRLARATRRLDRLLTDRGLTILGGTSLFRLARHPEAPAIQEDLCRAGILVRDFPERPTWLRFGLPDDQAQWTRLAAALER